MGEGHLIVTRKSEEWSQRPRPRGHAEGGSGGKLVAITSITSVATTGELLSALTMDRSGAQHMVFETLEKHLEARIIPVLQMGTLRAEEHYPRGSRPHKRESGNSRTN